MTEVQILEQVVFGLCVLGQRLPLTKPFAIFKARLLSICKAQW